MRGRPGSVAWLLGWDLLLAWRHLETRLLRSSRPLAQWRSLLNIGLLLLILHFIAWAMLRLPQVYHPGPAMQRLLLSTVLLSALLGGLILNLMPCVFPVLSIKAISLIEARAKVARRQRGHALAYTFGVLATFGGLAGLLLLLRSGACSPPAPSASRCNR